MPCSFTCSWTILRCFIGFGECSDSIFIQRFIWRSGIFTICKPSLRRNALYVHILICSLVLLPGFWHGTIRILYVALMHMPSSAFQVSVTCNHAMLPALVYPASYPPLSSCNHCTVKRLFPSLRYRIPWVRMKEILFVQPAKLVVHVCDKSRVALENRCCHTE